MEQNIKKLNLVDEKVAKRKRGRGGAVLIVIFSLCLIFLIGFLAWFFSSKDSTVSYVFNKVFSGSALDSSEDRVNVLLLGNAGQNHDGPYLTDTIIVLSYHLKTHKGVLISIPRDLWLDEVKLKVNAVYEMGEREKHGLETAKDQIDNILGVPIHYAVRIDFSGFEKAVDTVSGIEVDVPKQFDDYNYPIAGKENDFCGNEEKELELNEEQAAALKTTVGKRKVLLTKEGKIATESADFACRFEHIHFDKGLTVLDGKTALKFVRSRMGTNGEGSDFARSRRQQLVLQTLKEKVLSVETLFNLQKVTGLLQALGKSFETDIPKERFLDFYNLAKKVEKVESVVLGDLGEGRSLFYNPQVSEYGAWVLMPIGNDWEKIKDYVRKVLEEKQQKEE